MSFHSILSLYKALPFHHDFAITYALVILCQYLSRNCDMYHIVRTMYVADIVIQCSDFGVPCMYKPEDMKQGACALRLAFIREQLATASYT